MANISTLAKEVGFIRSGLPLSELTARAREVEKFNNLLNQTRNELNTQLSRQQREIVKEFDKKVGHVVRDNRGLLERVKDDFKKATKPLEGPLKKLDELDQKFQRMTKGFDKVLNGLSLGLGIAGTGISLLALFQSGANQAAFDRQVDAFQRDMSSQNTLIGRLKSALDKANATIARLNRELDRQSDDIARADSWAKRAYKLANDGLYESRVRISRIADTNNITLSKANQAYKLANDTLYELRTRVREINVKVSSADAVANRASATAITATTEAQKARIGVGLVDTKATLAQQKANAADIKAGEAKAGTKLIDSKATLAQDAANSALDKANQATSTNQEQNRRLGLIEAKLGVKTPSPTPTPTPTPVTPDNFQERFNRAFAATGITVKIADLQSSSAQVNAKAEQAIKFATSNPAANTALYISNNNTGAIEALRRDLEQAKATPIPDFLNNRITQIEKQQERNRQMNQEGNNKLDRLLEDNRSTVEKLAIITGAVGLMAPTILKGINDTISPQIQQLPNQTASAVAAAPCNGGGCGGKTAKRVNELGDELGALRQQVNAMPNTIANGINGFNAGANTVQLGLLNTINSKLGAQLPGGISGFLQNFSKAFEKFAEWSHLDRVLQLLTFAATVHNAYFLSSNLSQTFMSMISNVLQAFGIKDKEGTPLDINKIIGTNVENFIKSIIGSQTVESFKTEWRKYSAIYSAAANLLWSVQSLSQSILSAIEITAGRIGRVANALRFWGVVGEKAMPYMHPQPNFQHPSLTALQKGTEFVSQIDAVAGSVIGVQQAGTTLSQNIATMEYATQGLDAQGNPIRGTNDLQHVPTATKATQEKLVSKSSEIDEADLFPVDDIG